MAALCQKSFPQHETNNDTVIAGTGEPLIERYQLHVQLPFGRGGRTPEEARGEGGGRWERMGGHSLMKIRVLTLRHGCQERESLVTGALRI